MRAVRLVLVGVYLAYLVHVGFMMLVLPWSDLWPHVLLQLPPWLSMVLDQPLIRGLISGFGALHLLLALAEANPARFERRPGSPG